MSFISRRPNKRIISNNAGIVRTPEYPGYVQYGVLHSPYSSEEVRRVSARIGMVYIPLSRLLTREYVRDTFKSPTTRPCAYTEYLRPPTYQPSLNAPHTYTVLVLRRKPCSSRPLVCQLAYQQQPTSQPLHSMPIAILRTIRQTGS